MAHIATASPDLVGNLGFQRDHFLLKLCDTSIVAITPVSTQAVLPGSSSDRGLVIDTVASAVPPAALYEDTQQLQIFQGLLAVLHKRHSS